MGTAPGLGGANFASFFFFFRFLGASNHMTLLKCCEVLQPFSPSAVCMVCPQGFAVTVKWRKR